MSQPPYGPPGSGDDTPQHNPHTGLPENPGPETQQYGSDPYAGGQYGSQPGQYDAGQQGQYGGDQYSGDPYAGGQYSAQPGQYGGDQYSSDQYGASAAASPYGDGQYLNPIGGTAQAEGESDKSFVVTWLLGWLLGSLGADRFYLGKIGTAIAKLLTAGGFGIWALIDLIMHLIGATRDKQDRRLAGYDRHKKMAWIITIGVWLLQLVIGVVILIVVIATGGFSVSASPGPDTDPGSSQQGDPSADGSGDQGGTDDTGGQDAPAGEPASGDVVAWAESTYGTFDPVTVDGSGDQVVPLPDGVEAALITVEGAEDYTTVNALNADGEDYGDMYLFLPAGETGQGAVGVSDYDTVTDINVEADGDWSMTFEPIASADVFPESGSSPAYYLYDGPGGTADFEYTGEANIIINQYSAGYDNLVVNEIDAYSGTVELDPGPSLMRVIATGDWTLTPQ